MTSSARTLAGTTLLIVATMLASFAPTPLYPLYREEWSLSSAAISVAFAAYPLGVIAVVIACGGLSDRWGRLPTLRVGAACLAAAMATSACAPTIEVLVCGRLLQGIATGLITATGAAALMELHPRGPYAGSHRNALALSLGIALGPVLSAQAATRLPHPTAAPYVLVAVLVLLPLTILRAPRTSSRPALGGGFQAIRVPRSLQRSFCLAAVAIIGTNTSFAMLGSFGPDLVSAAGHPGPVPAGSFVTAVLLIIATMQVLGRRVALVPAMILGATLMASGWATIALGSARGGLGALLLGGAQIGVGAGLGLLASATHAGTIAPTDRRAEIYSAYLLAAFTGLGTAALLMGHVVEARSVRDAAAGAALVNLLAIAALLALRQPRPASV